MEHNMDKLLQSALTPDNMPEERLNRQIMHKAKEKRHTASRTRENKLYSAGSSTPSRIRSIFPTALAAACILAIFTITLSAVIRNADPILLSGETQPDYPTQSAPTEQTELPEETNPKESSIVKKLDAESSTAEERYKINIFLSNFSEQLFNAGSDTAFTSDTIAPDQLISFAYRWYMLNTEKSLEIIDGSYAILTFDQVNYALDRYFGLTLSDDDFANSRFEIRNQKIVMPFGSGESYPNFSVASEITEIGKGTYQVRFKIYSLIDAMSGGNKVTGKEWYCLTEGEASQSSALEYHSSGYAIVKPYKENGIDSYQLITYCLEGQLDISVDSELQKPLKPGKLGEYVTVDSNNNPIPSSNGTLFGFQDRLTYISTLWIGCEEFYVHANASSTLESQIGKSYSAFNLTGSSRDSTWCEGAEGSGIGEYVEIQQMYLGSGDDTLTFSEICIVNGYAVNEEKWQANNRVKQLKVYYGGTYVADLMLEDTINPQFFDISQLNLTVANGAEATFRFEIVSVYPGTTYDDTCITGIQIDFTGRDPSSSRYPINEWFPEKLVTVYMEGMPYMSLHIAGVPEIQVGEDGTVITPWSFVIYYDPARYVMTEEQGITYIRPSDPATEYPPCEMEIRHIPDVPPATAAEKTRGEMVRTRSDVSEITDHWDLDCIYFYFSEGMNWNSVCGSIYFFSDGMGGTFQITSRYIMEAAEGHGARFHAMLDTFTVFSVSQKFSLMDSSVPTISADTAPQAEDQRILKPWIGKFYIAGSAEAEDMLLFYDEDVFGFHDRMTWGCSSWCGCDEFYSNAVASSTLESQSGESYSASNLTEFFRDSTWCEGVEGSGIGETVEIKQLYRGGGDDIFTFSEFCIVNGYAMNESKWQANNRVSKLKVYYEDTYVATLLLEDTINPQFFDISQLNLTVGNGEEATFRFEIAGVYPGTTYDDTCITGIMIDFTGKYAH